MLKGRLKTAIVAALSAIIVILAIILAHYESRFRSSPRPAESPASARAVLTRKESVDKYRQIDKATASESEVREELDRRDAHDSTWQWKVPIQFFGQAVDENNVPIAGVRVHFQWTDLSSSGTSDRDTTSDSEGRFSLSGIRGKRLLVWVQKNGYYTADQQNPRRFEYANPYEASYLQPAEHRPVVFHLRRNGGDANLVRKSVELFLEGQGAHAAVDLLSGKISNTGELQVATWKPWPPRPMLPHYDWRLVLTITGGGFVESSDDILGQAPDTIYTEQYETFMPATAGTEWAPSIEKRLYFVFGEPQRYGSLHLRTSANSRYVFIDYVLNPSGSRNLK